MLVIGLKFLHFLALFAAGGLGIGGAIVQSALIKAGQAPSAALGRALRLLSIIGLIAIVTLWITGVGLAHALYGGLGINTAFGIKLGGASLVLASAVLSNLHLAKAARLSQAPNRAYLKPLMTLSRLGLVVALVAVAAAFR